MCFQQCNQQSGLGLPEVLVAVAVLAIALSGLLAAHWQARLIQSEALQRRHTLLLVADFSARLRLNYTARADYLSHLSRALPTTPVSDACAIHACLPSARARADITHFASELTRLLPQPAWQQAPCSDSSGTCLLITWAGATSNSLSVALP
jgi:type IV pilus assembly protein PilV